MSACRPGAVATIGGQRCVVLRDAVAHTLPPVDDLVVLDRLDERMIYCALSELKHARRRHPGLPAYGFWQILFHSGLVDKTERLQAVYFNDRDGQYLYQDRAAVAFSGEIRGGEMIAGGGYALDPGAVCVVACEARMLRLPRKIALSFEERERGRMVGRLRLGLRLAGVAVFVSAALLAYDGKRRADAADRQTARDALEVRAEAFEAHKAALQATRIGEWPDQRRTIDELLHLAIAFEKFTLPETPLGHSAFEVQVPDPSLNSGPDSSLRLPPLVSTIVDSVEHRRDGLLSLRWSRAR